MTKFIVLVFVLFSGSVEAAQISAKHFPWVQAVADSGASDLQICGSNKIVPSRRSIQRHFLVGAEKRGFFATGLPTIEKYFQVLATHNLAEAKVEMKKLFSSAELWTVTTDVRSLGKPTSVELPFTATVKDCVEGAKTTLGNDCSKNTGVNLTACCREKFTGPIVSWGSNQDHKLYFSPDPSVSLKVPNESTHRYCNVAEPMKINAIKSDAIKSTPREAQ